MYLLDTNVLSELRKAPPSHKNPRSVSRNVLAWSRSVSLGSMYISVITLLELERGTLLLERRDPRQGAVLRSWISGHVLDAFSDRTLVVDAQIALRCAAIHVPDPRSYRDSLIAATAIVHGMTVVTRNTSDFKMPGVTLLNPWDFNSK